VSEFAQLLERVDRQCRLAATARPDGGSGRKEIEDLLSEGYLAALIEERRSRRIAERLEALALELENEDAATEARSLALEKRTVDQRVRALRERLSDLRENLVQLGGHRPA